MILANIADFKSRLSHFLRLVKQGETVVICERNRPVAEVVAAKKPVDLKLRESVIGMYAGWLSDEELEDAIRPMSDQEAEALIEGRL